MQASRSGRAPVGRRRDHRSPRPRPATHRRRRRLLSVAPHGDLRRPVRHGETELNAVASSRQPTPLSARGLAAGRAAARRTARLAPLGVVRILTSDLRARRRDRRRRSPSATGAPIVIDPLLRERDFGDIRGTPYNELGRDPFAPDYHPPNGESWSMFHERVAAAWALVALASPPTRPGNLAVVTHGLVCRALVDRHLALPVGTRRRQSLWGNYGAHRDRRGAAVRRCGRSPAWRAPRRRSAHGAVADGVTPP